MKEEKKYRFILAIILALTSVICGYLFVHELKQGLVFAFAFIIIGLFPFERISIPSKYSIVFLSVIFIGSAFIVASLSQFLLNETLLGLGAQRVVLEIMICLALFMFAYVVFPSYKSSISIITILAVIISTVNHFVYEFKGNEFQPNDFFAARAALNVLRGYSLIITPTMFYAFVACAVYLLIIWFLPSIKVTKTKLARIVSALICLMIVFLFPIVSDSIHAQYFLKTGSAENGYLLNFILQMKSIHIDAPTGYSLDSVAEISDRYLEDNNVAAEHYPDIIVIMDESFAYLDHISDNLHTNIQIAPYIKSLSDKSVHGYALSSIFGGGTPNSEYEFLTGNSMIFMPKGTFVFSQHIKSPVYSMVSEMNSLGYRTIGMHPYLASGWNRDKVYPLLGFNECLFLDDFSEYEKIRNFTSDRGMFEKITEIYLNNETEEGSPLFLFGVTMQNHGGYQYDGDDFTATVKLDGYANEYTYVEQYLTLINETDSAVKYLIDFFEDANREVVIVFFGDHYPSLEKEFYKELYGGPFLSLDEQELQFAVPFFIWTNYSTVSKEIPLTSLNYLTNYVYEIAGIPLPPYNRFLKDVQSVIPAINSQGYYSMTEQRFLSLEGASRTERSILEQYNILEYNSLFDLNNLSEIFK